MSLVLSLTCSFIFKKAGVEALSAFTYWEIIVVFLIATLLMWVLRIVVKILYESTNSDKQAIRVLIYGALTGGIGLAKNIRSQKPVKYELFGFITHEHRIKNMQLLGVPVYTLDDDISEIIKRGDIQAVLVSPLRINEFRKNQKIQDVIIGAGCKIIMAQEAKEANIKDGVLSEEEIENFLLKEVSVEDLLPRFEIKVDLKSVEELLTGRRILITGAAGSIGSEIVRQVAQFKPEKLMLIDHAETPQHDIQLMMEKEFPVVPCEVVVTSISRRTT